MWPNPKFPPDLVTFTAEIVNWTFFVHCYNVGTSSHLQMTLLPTIYNFSMAIFNMGQNSLGFNLFTMLELRMNKFNAGLGLDNFEV